MRWVLVAIMALHGSIHFLGFAKAFGLAQLSQLKQPVSRAAGLAWFVAGLLMLGGAATSIASPRWFWITGAVAVAVSQAVIVASWSDAKVGSLANIAVLLGVALSFASYGPGSLRAEYVALVDAGLARPSTAHVVTEADLGRLPEPVQRYLRLTGSVGQPQTTSFRAKWKGRIRASETEPWMTFDAEQHNFYDGEPSRFFFMDATMKGLPVSVLHRFVGVPATFRVRLLSIFTVVDANGPEMNRSETVTVFNDLCAFAPANLIDAHVAWESIDASTARALYTRGAETIAAVLSFNAEGELVNFVSDDRSAASKDGTTFTRQRWSTPLREYRAFGSRRVSTHGEARWEPATGAFTYGEFELVDIAYDVRGTDR